MPWPCLPGATVLPACNSDQRTLPPIAEAMNLHLAEIATEASAAPLPSSGQIGGELELAVSLEEQHLFPVLKKHKETKNLVQDAPRDNREVRKLLGQLERTLKDDENFLPLEGHGAEETIPAARTRREEGMLPAVAKALSDEEAETILANIEDEKAVIEAAKRAEAEQRRARRERKPSKSKAYSEPLRTWRTP